MAELHWFPLYLEDWLTSRSITAMLPEQEGAYLRLLMHAWGDGLHEPWLEKNEAKLAAWSRLGSRWKKLGAAIVAEFEERDGKLFNVRLSAIWQEQQEKHANAVVKAKKAVATRESNKKKRQAHQDATREYPGDDLQDGPVDHLGGQPHDDLESKHLELDVVVEPSSKELGVLPSTATGRALAPDGARSGVADVRSGEIGRIGIDTLRRAVQPIPGDAPVTRTELDTRGRAIDKAYADGLRRATEEWKLLNGEAYAGLEKAECATWHISVPPIAGGTQRQMFDAALTERIRAHLKWPSQDEWVADKQKRGTLDAILRGAA